MKAEGTQQLLGTAGRFARRRLSSLAWRRPLAWLLAFALLAQSIGAPAAYASSPAAPRQQASASRGQSSAAEETITVFGPKRYDGNGFLTRAVEQFSLPSDAFAPFSVEVQNGGADGLGRALVGTVRLNGSALFSSGELNLQTPTLTQAVTLGQDNTLEISFLSRRPAHLTVTVKATRRPAPLPAPSISNFNPKRGNVGAVVTLSGLSLVTDSGPTVVTFAGPNNTRVPALVSFASAAEVRAAVPNGAATGTIELTTAGGRAATNGVFTVEAPQDFSLTVAPSSATAVQRGTATQVVALTSAQPDFTQLARLAATGLPAGVAAVFDPPQITSGGTSTLSLRLANADLSPGAYPFQITGTAAVEGRETMRAAAATLNVVAAGQTTLAGRVLSTDDEPIMGATVSLDGRSTLTDAAGSFLLAGITEGAARPLMIDGRTASAPNRTYPIIMEPAAVVAGQANVVPYTYFLPPIDVQHEVDVVPGVETLVENPRVEDLQMRIPAGANLRNRDGSPVARSSITPLQIDRTPTPLPPGVNAALVYTSQPGGALTDIPIPVVYPNLTQTNPGTRVELYAFNHDTVQWYVYGYGRVSEDGRTIAPETNPATGRPYGLPDFSWHFPGPPPGPCAGEGCNPNDPDGCGGGNYSGNPVDLASGVKVEETTDISFGGGRGVLVLSRTHTSDLGAQRVNGAFGLGTVSNYEYRLSGGCRPGAACRLLQPGQQEGWLLAPIRFSTSGPAQGRAPAAEAGVVEVFEPVTGVVSQLGNQLMLLSDGTFKYRTKHGDELHFDSNRRFVAMSDRNGNTATLSYTGSQLTRITDAVGRSITLEHEAGRISRATDPLGRAWQYSYDASGRLTSVTDPLHNVTRYGYTDDSRLSSVTDARGQLVKRLTYNAAGRVVEQLFADGGFERYQYFLSGTRVTLIVVADSLGRTETKQFNSAGYVITHADALGQVTRIRRDLNTNLPLATEGPCGCAEETREFDARGNLLSVTDRLGHTARFEYDPDFSRITKVTDKLGRVTTLSYDARGNLLSATDALGRTTAYAYDEHGLLASVTDPLAHTRRFEYDAGGNLSAALDPLGNRAAFEYDAVGRMTAALDPLGRRAARSYDLLDRLVRVTDAAGQHTRYRYDPVGNLESAANALGQQWSYEYDAKNRLVASTDPLGRTSRMEHNADDELTRVVSPSGRATAYAYDQRGLLLTATNLLGEVVRHTYDNAGDLSTLVDQRGHTTTFSYDELHRLASVLDPLGRKTSHRYDAASNLVETTDRLGRRTTTAFDALDRPERVAYADAVVTQTFDPAGRLTRLDDTQGGSIVWAYDEADRLLSETAAAGAVGYGYNAAGQRTALTIAGRAPVTYAYDPVGRLQSIARGAETFTYSYDALSRRAGLQRPNGVRTSYAYNAAGRFERMTHANALRQAIEDYRYTYNPDDEIEAVASLASATTLPATANVGAADAANRVRQFGQTQLGFDDEGQTTTKTDGASGGATSFTWDARGRMTAARLPDGQTVGYAYDALGRMTSRTSGGAATAFLYDGDDAVLDRPTGGGTATDYLNGPGTDDKLLQTSASTGPLYFLQDHLGSTTALTTANSVVERLQYTAFGDSTGSAFTRFTYTGRERDPSTGLMFYRARWYDTQQGRFVTEDPIGFEGHDANLYRYALGDPINFNDPSGLAFDPIGNFKTSLDWTQDRAEDAVDYYAGVVNDPNASWIAKGASWVGGPLASLWTHCNAADTAITLAPVGPIGRYLGRPFFRYVGPKSMEASRWLTRGRGWKAPYGRDFARAKDELQMPHMPTNVEQVKVPWWQPVRGPRTVSGNPQWGRGGGTEYHRGWRWPR